MQPSVTATIVIPCYNEEARLNSSAFLGFIDGQPQVNFLFVDDGSRDGTWGLIERLATANPERILALRLERNSGKAEAVRQGMLAAARPSTTSATVPCLVGFWDADLATPLAVIPEFLHVFSENPSIQMVFGARVKLLGRAIKRNPLRHFLGRIFATVASLLLRIPIYDTQCGAKIFRNTPDFHDVCREPLRTRWIFDVELLARYMNLIRANRGTPVEESIYEYPLTCWEDVPGSKIRSHDVITVLRDLWRIKYYYLTNL